MRQACGYSLFCHGDRNRAIRFALQSVSYLAFPWSIGCDIAQYFIRTDIFVCIDLKLLLVNRRTLEGP